MSRAEKEARLERGREVLRREGMADAALRLVATRFTPGRTVSDYQVALGLSQVDIQRAIARCNGPATPASTPLVKARPSTSTGPVLCPEVGCDERYSDARGLASHRLAAHTPPVECPNGCGRLINRRGIGPHLKNCSGPPDHPPAAA